VRSPVVKRAIDVIVAGTALAVAALPMAVVALAVRITMGSPVLFRQQRPGLHGEPFTLVKFRTMRDGAGDDAARLTRLGSFLRRTSLDELPEMWNVFVGDMSLVGPRPLLTAYLPRYSPEQARRHEVKPGITGLAQVEGRNLVAWEERFRLDVRYVDTWTVGGDLRILARTLRSVLAREGISADGHVTMPEFMGSEAPPPSDVSREQSP
jgi:lipopolysaccharide/colanic/teichoic acid biosynthesis glycosyltransferase